MSKSIRVLIVDDSSLAGSLLATILETDSAIAVVGVAHNGLEALEQIPRLRPDLVTMDVWMPRMDGFAAVEQIMAYHPTPILVVTTSLQRPDVDISLRMLAAGALDLVEKPSHTDEATWTRGCRTLIEKVKILSQVSVVSHLKGRHLGAAGHGTRHAEPPPDASGRAQPARDGAPGRGEPGATSGQLGLRGVEPADLESTTPQAAPRTPPSAHLPTRGPAGASRIPQPTLSPPSPGLSPRLPPRRPQGSAGHYVLVGIASSTGGPRALHRILCDLPAEFAPPILIVQHIAPGFTHGLADWLAHESGREVRLAQAGERPAPRTVLLAPDAHHLVLQADGCLALLEEPARDIRPSADVTLHSLADVLGPKAIGVILTGMGRDGADGLRAMRLAGAYTIAQDEASSIIFGMPRAAISLGIIDAVLPVDAIAERLARLVGS